MRRSGMAGLVTVALFVLGPQAWADPGTRLGSGSGSGSGFGQVFGPACLFTAGFAGGTPFAPVVGAACPPEYDSGGGAV